MVRHGSPSDDPPRVAFAVPRSVGNSVIRNRIRRRMREAVRHHAGSMTPGSTYLVAARPGAERVTYGEIETTVGELIERCEAVRP